MKDAYEILRQKEVAIELVRKEIAALRFVAPLLTDDGDSKRMGESARRRIVLLYNPVRFASSARVNMSSASANASRIDSARSTAATPPSAAIG